MYNYSPDLMMVLADEHMADLQQRARRESPRFALFARRPRTAPQKSFRNLPLTRRKAF